MSGDFRTASGRVALAVAGVMTLATASSRATGARSRAQGDAVLTWERAFPIDRPDADVHLNARFTGSDGQAHRLELWRHGQTFLHRKTDDVLDLYVVSRPGQNDYRYRFVDHRRHVVTDVRRDNLYRIGVFSDWFGLAHVVDRPKTAFRVRPIANPHPDAPRGDCVWRELATGADGTAAARICWSTRWAAALVIEQPDSSRAWTERLSVTTVEPTHFRRGTTSLPARPAAYGHVDADETIAPQSGD